MGWNIADLIEASADAVPEREALVCGDARVPYAALEERANRLAHHLLSAGVGAGDHLGVQSVNRVEWVEALLACFKLRAVPININYRYEEAELRYLFDNAELVGLIFERRFAPRVREALDGVQTLRHRILLEDGSDAATHGLGATSYEEALAAASPKRDFGPRSPDDRYLLYTGGTTGMPKGVVWRQEDVIFALGGGIDFVTGEPHVHPEDLTAKTANPPLTTLVLPPLMHGAGQWATLGGLFVGNRIVHDAARSFEPDRVWALAAGEKANLISLTGDAMARPLAEALLEDPARHDLTSLVAIASTAAIFSPSVKAQFRELFPTLVITDSIGASETGFHGTSMYADAEAPKREGAGVCVRPGRDTIVVDEELEELAAGSEAVGRLARSGNVPLGYFRDPEKTRATFFEKGGRRYAIPGDFAKVEADGSITLLGRGSVCINSGGEKVYPEEVEGVLKGHPAVFDALVVGVPDARFGERVAAVVAARPGEAPTLAELDAHCRGRIAGYKIPRALHLVDAVQRQPSGKPDYPWAKRLASTAD